MTKINPLDYLAFVLIAIVITLHPYFMHGNINFYETGIYLPQINELWHGKVIYKDMFIMRGPLEILMPKAIMDISGKHITALYVYFYLGTVLTLIIYGFLGARIFKTRNFAYLFILVLIARTFPRVCFQIWGGIRFGLGALALLAFINYLRNKKPLWLILSGVFTGIAFWTSFEIGLFGFIAIIASLIFCEYIAKKKKGFSLKAPGIYTASIVIISLPFIIYLISQKAIFPYLEALLVVSRDMTKVFDPALCFETPTCLRGFISALVPTSHNFKYTLPFFFYAGIGLWLVKVFAKHKFTVKEFIVMPIFIYGILLYKSAFRDIEGPQYRMALQPLLLIMFFYIEEFYIYLKGLKQASGIKKILIMAFIIVVPIYCLAFSFSKYNKRFFIFSQIKTLVSKENDIRYAYSQPNPSMIQSERAKGIVVSFDQAKEIDNVVKYISSNTDKDDIIFTFPDLGTYNFLFDRPPLGRFHTAEFSFMSPKWFNEMMHDLKSKNPKYIIISKEFSRLQQFQPTLGKYLDEVTEYLDKNYDVVVSYSTVSILKIK